MFRDLMTLQDRMNRLFEESLPRYTKGTGVDEQADVFGTWAPAVDIYETDQSIVLKADLPEINPEDVEIRVEDNILYLKGARKMEKEVRQENYHRVERAYGTFARSFALPHTVSADKIAADYNKGVLRVTMPKREESKPKQIKISVKE